ncbi:MAG TPA: hypothetical protein VHN77_12225 [Phycisphaerales bacterium]|nr:hypothetical protein [Phycisphaerales bacterium]
MDEGPLTQPVEGGVQTIPPLHTLSFPQGNSVQSVAIAPDCATAYVNIHVPTFDFGAFLDTVVPLATSTFGIVLGVITIVMVVRVLRRRRTKGLPYCRSCNYCLDGLPQGSGTCPECGADLSLRKPVMGQSVWRRVRSATILSVVALGVAVGGYLIKRRVYSFQSTGWNSRAVAQWLTGKPFVARLPSWWWSSGEVILAVDTTTGSWRVVTERVLASYFELALTPDGGGIYLQSPKRDGLDLVSTVDGSELARLRCGESVDFGVNARAVIGHSPNGTETWLSGVMGQKREKAVAICWNRSTGAWRVAASRDSYAGSWAAHFILAPGTPGQHLLSYPDFMEAFPTKTFEVQWHDAAGTVVSKVDLGPKIAYNGTPIAFSPDGTTLLAGGNHQSPDLFAFDVASLLRGEANPAPLRAARGSNDLSGLSIPPGRSDILMYEQFQHVRIASPSTGQPRYTLTLSSGLYGVKPVISDNGRWVAATAQRGTTGTNWSHDLLIWRLPDDEGP